MRLLRRSLFDTITCSPPRLRIRVVLRPTCSTVPCTLSTVMKSPTTNGLSSTIASAAKRSPRMFCTASAMAIPPIPRPVMSAVTSTPNAPSAITSSTIQSVKRAAYPTACTVARVPLSASPARRRYCSTAKPISPVPQRPACSRTTTTIRSWMTPRAWSVSTRTREAAYRATAKRKYARVRRTRSTPMSSTRVAERAASTPSRRTRTRRSNARTTNTPPSSASAISHWRSEFAYQTRSRSSISGTSAKLRAQGGLLYLDSACWERPRAHVALRARPHVVHRLTEVLQDVACTALRGLAIGDHGAELGAILRAALLVIREVRAEIDVRHALIAGALPQAAAIFAHQAVPLEEHEHDLGLASRDAALVREVVDQDAFAERYALEHQRDLGGFFDVGVLAAEEIRLHSAVLDAIEDRARGWQTIAAGTTGFLIIGLDRTRKVVMRHEADVRLVDAEAECVGRDDGAELVRHEAVLRLLAVGSRHLAVIQSDRELRREPLVQALGFAHRGAVDDTDAVRLLEEANELFVLHPLIHGAPHLESEVRPRKSRDRHVRVAHAELPDDVLADFVSRRRGQRENRRASETRHDRAEGQIVGTEVVTPLTDAMRLIHDEQRHSPCEQTLEELAVLEPLGREVQDLALALRHLTSRLARLGGVEVRVHGERFHPGGGELVLLILH